MSIDFKYKPEGDTLKTFMKSDDFFVELYYKLKTKKAKEDLDGQ